MEILTARLHVTSKDEIGDIANSFNQMLTNLQHIIKQVQQTSTSVKEASEKCIYRNDCFYGKYRKDPRNYECS